MTPELKQSLGISSEKRVAGGCIHDCYRVTMAGASRFLKTNSENYEDAFAAEADGLAALRAAGMPAPEPHSHGVAAGRAYLVLDYLDLTGRKDFAALGRMLAAAHRQPGPRFGWRRDNYIGATPQANGWCDDWQEFWLERRIRPQIELARRNGFELAAPGISVLKDHEPQPSLLHGDLWSGNAGFTAEGPVVFDPAVYYGDREADLAMTELFGGFPTEFYRAYHETWPLDKGYERRKPMYNLYHLLNHLNLFGGSYLAQVNSTLQILR
ncbi:MAG TPA: fructosamine kinase family protein [Burkholderiales bacterium]|nr:fructosamine kinase family protein [Burkholderiales bacterium]